MPNDELNAKVFRAEIIASDGPAFGAYLAGTARDGEAKIVLNLKLCLNVDHDPKGCAAQVLAHEVLHACQDIMGQALTEADIVENLDRINEAEFEVCEDTEQMIQNLTQEIQDLRAENARWRQIYEAINGAATPNAESEVSE